MGGKLLKFKKNPLYTHHRSEGLTHRGQARILHMFHLDVKEARVGKRGSVSTAPSSIGGDDGR